MVKRSKKQNPVNESIKLLKEGFNKQYIQNYLLENFDSINGEEQANLIIAEAESVIKKEFESKRENVLNLHVVRYRKEIERLMNIEELPESGIGQVFTYEQWQESRNRKIKAGLKALDCMKQLENLMMLHNDSTTTIDLDEQININSTVKNHVPDFSKLTTDQQIRYYELLMEMKVVENEPISVIQPVLRPVIDVIDISSSVVEKPNIEQIKQEMKDSPVNHTTTLTPKQKLMESLRKIAAGKFKEAGAKLDSQEQTYLLDRG